MDEIKEQTEELAAQLKKLESVPEGDDEQYIKELEKFNWDLKDKVYGLEREIETMKIENK